MRTNLKPGSGYYPVIFSILLLIGTSSCAGKPLTTVIAQDSAHSIQRLLVLPFGNESDKKQLGIIATRICRNQYSSRGFKGVDTGDLRIYLQRHHLFLSQLTEEGTPQLFAELARELQVSTLIKGKILTADYKSIQGESVPVISLQLELLNAQNGKLLTSSFLTGSGENYRTLLRFGVLRTTTQLLNQMIKEITDNWHKKGVFL